MIDRTKILSEVKYQTSRSGGAGGQHVNKVETRVTLIFDLKASEVLTEDQKRILQERVPFKISGQGIIQVNGQKYRSQLRNKELCNQLFIELILQALKPIKKRKARKVSEAQKRKRLEAKKRRSDIKQSRKKFKY